MLLIIDNALNRFSNRGWIECFADGQKKAEDVKEKRDLLIPWHMVSFLKIERMLLHVASNNYRASYLRDTSIRFIYKVDRKTQYNREKSDFWWRNKSKMLNKIFSCEVSFSRKLTLKFEEFSNIVKLF